MRMRSRAAVVVATVGAGLLLGGCDSGLGGEPSRNCSPRMCTLQSDNTCRCSDTSTQGTHSCAGSADVWGSNGVAAGGACLMNGQYSEYCKAGLTCVIDYTQGRSAGVCEVSYGRCPLERSSPMSEVRDLPR